jgi:hypothetical protein
MKRKNENGREPANHNNLLKRFFISLCLIAISMLTWKAVYAVQPGMGESQAFAQNSPAGMPQVKLSAVSGATIPFTDQSNRKAATESRDIPYLVLSRNGVLTDPAERTLVVSISNLVVPEGGITVTLRIETQHGDPDLGGGEDDRITVWKESRWIDRNQSINQTPAEASFRVEFKETIISDQGSVPTPTDYYRVELVVAGAGQSPAKPSFSASQEHAFLLERQWTVPIDNAGNPLVSGPKELVVYACDMFLFQKEASSKIARTAVAGYVQSELVPNMAAAIRMQTQDWGFSWEGWESFDNSGNRERLGVALSDGKTWFHGSAPERGNSSIAINVNGGDNAEYDTLTDGIMSTFHHELFHNLQRAIAKTYGGSGNVVGKDSAWLFFAEGMASFVPSVAQPRVQFSQTKEARAYIAKAVQFVGGRGFPGELNTSYTDVNPYHGALYWRFLYEQCGGMRDGIENPRAGMGIIRRSLQVLYSKEIVDIETSTDLVKALPQIMGKVLTSPEAAACPFSTYEDSLDHFARAIYSLRLEGGRCSAPGIPSGCGFYDPNNLYSSPKVIELSYTGKELAFSANEQPYPAGIRSSYGMDFIDLQWKPKAAVRSLNMMVYTEPQSEARFHVQLIKLTKSGSFGISSPKLVQVLPAQVLTQNIQDGFFTLIIPAGELGSYNRIGVIITRVDTNEASGPTGAYTLVVKPVN